MIHSIIRSSDIQACYSHGLSLLLSIGNQFPQPFYMCCNGTAFGESSLVYILGDSYLLMVYLVHYHAFHNSHERALNGQDPAIFMCRSILISRLTQECYPSRGYQIIGFLVQSLARPLAEVFVGCYLS